MEFASQEVPMREICSNPFEILTPISDLPVDTASTHKSDRPNVTQTE